MRKTTIAGVLLTCGTIITIGWQMGVQGAPSPTTHSVNVPVASSQTAAPQAASPTTPTSVPSNEPSSAGAPATTTPTTPSVPAAKSGTITGDSVQTPYGDVQVSVTFSGNKITDVTALQLTNDSPRSESISNRAAPQLQAAVLQSQSANVDTVSGATYTSEGYLQSVQSAIDKHNA